jgi:formylglycine-generating enzyme required for sulfatase activity
VTGGTFYRSYDGVSASYTSQAYPATVSDFRLDKFEITVGRFRKFKAAWDGGWRPAGGAGKHSHLNAGSGLTDSSGTSTNEPGWNTAWASYVVPTDANLTCNATYRTWTAAVSSNETLPINCANWYEVAAFCIWDNGFLPSEAEWNYAAAGGTDQRVYPWSSPSTSTAIDTTYANYLAGGDGFGGPSGGGASGVGSRSPKGDGKFGQADLAGNVWEANRDGYTSYVVPCTNCADTAARSADIFRGGSFMSNSASLLLASNRYFIFPLTRGADTGARCARGP